MHHHHTDLTAPTAIEIHGGLKDGHQIFISGKVSDSATQFRFDIQRDTSANRDIALHFNPRINQNTVVRNTYLNGWQNEERDIPNFPFGNGQEFDIHIVVTSECFVVYVNAEYYISYKHRLNHHEMSYLNLSEGADWHEVEIREKARVPYTTELPELSDGMCVKVRGLIYNEADRFAVNFMDDPNSDNIAFHCNPRQVQKDTVLNSKINGRWGPEERGFSYFPFTAGAFFDLTIFIHGGSFIVSASGKHLASYAFRVPLEEIHYLNVTGDIDLMEVHVCHEDLNDCVKPIHGGLQTDDLITVHGYFKPGGERFAVDLLTGLSRDCNRALHVNPRRGQNEVVLNNTVNGVWQEEIKYPLPPQMHSLVPFTMDIVNKESGFNIFIDGAKIGSFPHRENVENIKSIYCTADAYFHDITVTHKLPNPHAHKTAATPKSGSWLSIVGIPTPQSNRFIVDVSNSASEILFHYNPRFSEGTTVRNTFKNNSWGVEERDETSFPFNPQDIFEINMLLTDVDYKVVANGKRHVYYKHRIPPSQISNIITRMDADFYVKECY